MTGYCAAAVAVLIWASYPVATRAAVTGAFAAEELVTLRFGVGALLFLPYLLTHFRGIGREAWLRGVHISPWTHTAHDNHEPLRPRKLLLHKGEIAFLERGTSTKGYTIVPLRIYTKNGRAKVELGLAKGKRRFEKRQVIKEREANREMDAAIRRRAPRTS